MHTHSLDAWRHSHLFLGERHGHNERRVWIVVALTVAMMIAEVAGGIMFGSVALTADGWHMATHAAALSISGISYAFARRHAHNPHYTFGTGKFGELAGYTSAIILGLVSLGVAYEALTRMYEPVAIDFQEALAIAAVGLLVNIASAWLLSDRHHHHRHDESADHHHGHHHHHAHASDGNQRAAFAHVVADAATSALAIVALLAASFFGWTWIDPLVGLAGAVLIATWAFGLMRSSSAVLLDRLPSEETAAAIRKRLETSDERVSDLHIWQLGPGHIGMIASIVADDPKTPEYYKSLLKDIPNLSHVTVEVFRCTQ